MCHLPAKFGREIHILLRYIQVKTSWNYIDISVNGWYILLIYENCHFYELLPFVRVGQNWPLVNGSLFWQICYQIFLPYSDKRKQLTKMTFLVNEQNVSTIYTDINVVPWCLHLNISQQDVNFSSKLGREIAHAKDHLNMPKTQIWRIWELLPFVRVGQYSLTAYLPSENHASPTCKSI